MSDYITETYTLKYYGECCNYRRQRSRVEIWWKGTLDSTYPRRIADITGLSLAINGNEDIDAPVVKTILTLSMADTRDEPQEAGAGLPKHGAWEEFYTPDSTAYLVRLFTREDGEEAWTPRWSGYITPDNWKESISFRGSVSVTARDNLGHLKDFAFDLAADGDGMVSARDVITGALAKIAFPMDVILGVAADGERATLLEADAAEGSGGVWDALFLASMFKDSSWEDVFTAVLDSLGLTVRFVDNNRFAITFIRNLPLCGGTAAPEVQAVEFYGAGTRMLVPAYREVKIGTDFDYERDVPFPSGVTGQYGTDESFRWSYYDDRLQRTVSGNAMRTDVAAPAIGWGSSGKAFVNTGTYRISSPRDRVAVIDPDTTALIIANASQPEVRTAMAIYNFGAVNTPAGKVRLDLVGSLSLAGLYLIRSGSAESLEWAASYQTDSDLLWWNGSQWKAGGQTWARTENGDMDFSAPMNLQDVPSGGTLRVFIRDVVASAGFCVAVAGVTLICVDPASSLKSDTVTVVNNPDYNVRAERSPDFAPLSRSVAWNVPGNYPNALWRRRGGDSLSPFPYEVIWSDGEERLPLPVQWAKQTLMFHHSALQLIEGEVGVPGRGMWRFDRPAVYKGHQFIPQGGTLDLQTGHLSGARLREYIDYATLWAGGVTVVPSTASFPAAGGQVSFALTCAADKDWVVTGLPDWLEADVTSGRGGGTVTLTASRNDGGTRSVTVYIGGQAVRVSQEQEDFALSITPSSVEVPEEGQSLYLTVQASPTAGWRVVSSEPTWMYVNGLDEWQGAGYTDALLVSVQANETGASRTASLQLYDGDGVLVQTVPVSQTAEAAELTLTITTNVSSPTIALTVDGSAVPYSAGMVIPAGAAVGVTVSKTGYTSVTDSFAMSAANSSKYYELTQDIPATISYPDEITSAAQSVRFTISDPSGHGWSLDWTSESYYGYITGGAVVSGNATRNGSVISGTGNAVVTLSVAANTNDYGRWVGQNPAPIYFSDNSTGSYEEVNFYQNEGSATIVPVTGVTLNKSSLSLSTGGSERLTATVKPTNATNPALSWTSTNTSVATVDQDGTVRAVGAGTCVIRATATDGSGKYGSCSVTVTAPTVRVTGVSLDKSSLSLSAGGSSQLTATVYPANAGNKAVSWSSSDTSVASVSSSGLVTAVGGGVATITVTTADGGYTASCAVTVKTTPSSVPVTGVSLNESSLTLTVGESSQLSATVYPANADNKAVSWSSSNPTVASVSSGGLVTAVNGGQAIITVTTADGGYTASCAVTVKTIIHTLSVYDARLETSPTVDFSFMLTNTTLGNTLKGVTVRLRDASKSYDDTLLDYESEKFVGLLQAQGGTFVYSGTITATTAMIQSGVGMRLWVRFRYSGDGAQYTGYSDVAIPQD